MNPGKWGAGRSVDIRPRPPGPKLGPAFPRRRGGDVLRKRGGKLGPVFPPRAAENCQFGAAFPVSVPGAVCGLP